MPTLQQYLFSSELAEQCSSHQLGMLLVFHLQSLQLIDQLQTDLKPGKGTHTRNIFIEYKPRRWSLWVISTTFDTFWNNRIVVQYVRKKSIFFKRARLLWTTFHLPYKIFYILYRIFRNWAHYSNYSWFSEEMERNVEAFVYSAQDWLYLHYLVLPFPP